MEILDLNNKRKREKLTASEWNSLIDAINLLILRYNDEATIPTKLSQLINDAGFITDISGKADKSDLARVATTGSYNDLKDKPDLSNIGSAGKSAYELAVENGYQGTIQLWLLSLKGQDGTNGTNGQDGTNGTDGITPHIDPTSKHWMIGETDTGIVAEGLDGTNGQNGSNGTNGSNGITPHIDPTTGNWFIGETNTGVSAQGPAGNDGSNGSNGNDGVTPHIDSTTGNWFIGNTDTGVHAQGPAGQDGTIAGQLQADWNESDNTSKAYIANKPTIPTVPTNYVTTDTTQMISGTKTFTGGTNSTIYTGHNPIKLKAPGSGNNKTTGFTFFDSSDSEKGYVLYNQTKNAMFFGKYHSDAKTGFLNETTSNTTEEIYIPNTGTTGVWYIPVSITDGTTTVSAGSNGTVNMSSFGYAKVWNGTQSLYDALSPNYDSNTIYIIS